MALQTADVCGCMPALGDEKSFSMMLVEGIANELCGGKGHGSSANHRLGHKNTLLNCMMTTHDGSMKQVLRSALADSERSSTHLRDQLVKKQKSGGSYAAIATFSKDFLVPWAGARHLTAQGKKTLAFQDAFFMHCGPQWVPIDLEEREASIARYRESLNWPDKKAAYLRFISTTMAALRDEDPLMSGKMRLTEANSRWRNAEENPNKGIVPQYLRHKRRRMRREMDGNKMRSSAGGSALHSSAMHGTANAPGAGGRGRKRGV